MDDQNSRFSNGLRNPIPGNHTTFIRFPELCNLEVLHAAYTTHSFSPHFHEGHVIGLIEKGVLGFDYKGEKLTATAGQINIADPGEVHNGFGLTREGWQYRMFYLGAGQIEAICEEIMGPEKSGLIFRKGVIKDRVAARHILNLHKDFQRPDISLLELTSRFQTLITGFVQKHVAGLFRDPEPGKEKKAVRIAKEFMAAHYEQNLSLDQVSRVAGLSRYYFLRVFQKSTGLTPHAFLNQIRCARAKALLDKNMPISQAALETGFFDQSHLNRIFKKIYGITPGQYGNIVQESSA